MSTTQIGLGYGRNRSSIRAGQTTEDDDEAMQRPQPDRLFPASSDPRPVTTPGVGISRSIALGKFSTDPVVC
jgi:hypothetical protein